LVQLDDVAGGVCHESLISEARNVLGPMDFDAVFANRCDCLPEVFNLNREMRWDDLAPFEQMNLTIAELQPRAWGCRAVGSLNRDKAEHIAVKGVR
jgi:hypothetical protein